MFVHTRMSQAMLFRGIHLEVVWFVVFDELRDEHLCVFKVHVLVNQPMRYEQSILPIEDWR